MLENNPSKLKPEYFSSFSKSRKLFAKALKKKPLLESNLFKIVELSKKDKRFATASAAAITALNDCRVSFSGMDLRGISIPGADLSGAILDSANLSGSDLKNVKIKDAFMQYADLSECNLKDLDLGEFPSLKGHSNSIYSIKYSPDNKTIASCCYNCSIFFWDPKTGNQKKEIHHTSSFYSICYLPDGKHIVSGDKDGNVIIWDVTKGEKLKEFKGHKGTVFSVAVSSDGKHIASAGKDHSIRLWDVKKGSLKKIFNGHKDVVRSVAFSSDNETIVSGGDDSTIKIWDLKSLKIDISIDNPRPVTCVSFSKDGQLIAFGDKNYNVSLLDRNSGELLKVLKGHNGWINDVVYSKDGKILASCDTQNKIRFWDAYTGDLKKIIFIDHSINCLSLSPDGLNVLYEGSEHIIHIKRIEINFQEKENDDSINNIYSAIVSHDSSLIVSGNSNSNIYVQDSKNGKLISVLKGHRNGVYSVCFTKDDKKLLSASCDNSLKVWDVASWEEEINIKSEAEVYSACFSPDESLVAYGCGNGSIYIWNTNTRTNILELKGHKGYVVTLAFTPDGKTLISGSRDDTIRFWDIKKGKAIKTIDVKDSSVKCISFSPDGKKMVIASRKICLINPKTGEFIKTIEAPSYIYDMDFTSDGKFLISGDQYGKIHIYDSNTFEMISSFKAHRASINGISCFPGEDDVFASVGSNGYVSKWQIVQKRFGVRGVLLWASKKSDELIVNKINLKNARGLSVSNSIFFKQHNAVNIPLQLESDNEDSYKQIEIDDDAKSEISESESTDTQSKGKEPAEKVIINEYIKPHEDINDAEDKSKKISKDEESDLDINYYKHQADILYSQGNINESRNMLLNASRLYSKGIEKDPNNIEYYFERGRIFRMLKYFDEAISDFKTITKIKPECFDAFYELAVTRRKKGNFGKAIVDINNALKYCNDCKKRSGYFILLGDLFFKIDQVAAAEDSFNKAIKENQDNAIAYNKLGEVYMYRNKLSKALKIFNRAIQKDSNNPLYYYNRGKCFQEKKKYMKSAEDYLVVIRLNSRFPDVRKKLLEIAPMVCSKYIKPVNKLRKQNRHQDVYDIYDKLIIINPENASYYFERAYSSERLGNYKDAIEDYNLVLLYEPGNTTARDSIERLTRRFTSEYEKIDLEFSQLAPSAPLFNELPASSDTYSAPFAYKLYNISGSVKEAFEIKDYYKNIDIYDNSYQIKRIPDKDKPPYHIFNKWHENTGIIGISEKLFTFIEKEDKDNKSYLDNPDNGINITKLTKLLKKKGAGTIALENKIREEISEIDERKDWVDKYAHPLILSDKLNSERINFEIKSAIKSFEGMTIEEAYLCWKVWEKWSKYEISKYENINNATQKVVQMHKSVFEYMAENKIDQIGSLSAQGIIFEDGIVKGKEGGIENIIASGQASAYCA